MSDYSRSRYAVQDKSTVYGIDTALVIVIFASALFWLSIGVLVWLLVSEGHGTFAFALALSFSNKNKIKTRCCLGWTGIAVTNCSPIWAKFPSELVPNADANNARDQNFHDGDRRDRDGQHARVVAGRARQNRAS